MKVSRRISLTDYLEPEVQSYNSSIQTYDNVIHSEVQRRKLFYALSNYFRLTIKLQNDTFTFNQKQTKLKFDLETQSDVLEATLINLNSTSDTLLDLEKSINESNSQNKTKINLLENQYTESSKRLAESIQQNLDTNDLVKKLTLNLHCEQELNAKLVIQLASLEELKNEAEETIVQSQRKQTQELNMIKIDVMQLENIRSKLNASDVLMKKVKSELRGKEDDFNRLQIENKKLKYECDEMKEKLESLGDDVEEYGNKSRRLSIENRNGSSRPITTLENEKMENSDNEQKKNKQENQNLIESKEAPSKKVKIIKEKSVKENKALKPVKEKNVSKKKPTRLSSSPEKVQANKSIPSSPLSSIKSSIKNRKDERVTVLKSYAELNVSSETEHPIQLSRLVDEKVMVDIIEHLSEVEVLPRNHAKRKSLEIKPTRKLKRTKSNESRIQVDRNLQAIEKMDESVDQETSGRQEEEKEEENFVKKPSLLGRMGIFGGKSLGVKSKRELALKSGEGLVSQATSTLFNSL